MGVALPAWMLGATITVEPYQGADGFGRPVYGDEVVYPCYIEEKRRLVRDATGDQVTADTTVYLGGLTADVPLESRVTKVDGRRYTAIQVLRHDGAGMPTPDHIEVILL